MDWLDEVFDRLRVRIVNLSLKKALVVYILICIGLVVIATAITQTACSEWDNFIWSKYSPGVMESLDLNSSVVYYQDYSKLKSPDNILVEVIDFIQTWSTIIYSLIGILGLSILFYNSKMKEPLGILKEAAEKVGKNDLDIELYYDNRDELGELCRSFDSMRKQLIANNQKMWDMMEEQKRLNAAFAHDLRTPLTVLRGYTDLLKQYVPEGKISEEKLLSTLSLISAQVSRLESYSNTMKEISSMDEIPVNRVPTKASALEIRVKDVIGAVNGKNGITIKFIPELLEDAPVLLLDETIILEVFENLLSNALRYAEKEIEVILSLSEDGRKLLLSVADDGKGFTDTDLIMATKAYYTDRKEKKSEHFGIGLYICKILCEKHRGTIALENRMKQGAIVTAAFSAAE